MNTNTKQHLLIIHLNANSGTLTDLENKLTVAREAKDSGRDVRELRLDIHTAIF